MTIWDALLALVHRWYVLLGAVLIGLLASYVAVSAEGAYWSKAEVTFLAPTSAINPNALRTTSSDLIIAAGAVAKRVNGNATWNQMADPAATIVGQGIVDGSQVKLPDHGGQWSRVYPRQVLDVQVSGPTAEVVRTRRAQLLESIDTELAGLQQGVAPSDRITTAVVPAAPSIIYIHGSKVRALVMIWVLVGVGVLAAIQILEPHSRQPWSGAVPALVPSGAPGRRAAPGTLRTRLVGHPPRGKRPAVPPDGHADGIGWTTATAAAHVDRRRPAADQQAGVSRRHGRAAPRGAARRAGRRPGRT
ncbi:hypothetical protein [Cellulomonas humilata]|uniref:Polysaccharide chain length determinant N-terminal domain-containing protein n=1 Tax=Cellulomonas humilata TaxID=144055 RepID=A0ABU0E9M8_9CELL|nr:hypothetical protein [Cellulomonas humilata]MDQ0371967.1 hypothetical protein [Cellulomonas humilata]